VSFDRPNGFFVVSQPNEFAVTISVKASRDSYETVFTRDTGVYLLGDAPGFAEILVEREGEFNFVAGYLSPDCCSRVYATNDLKLNGSWALASGETHCFIPTTTKAHSSLKSSFPLAAIQHYESKSIQLRNRDGESSAASLDLTVRDQSSPRLDYGFMDYSSSPRFPSIMVGGSLIQPIADRLDLVSSSESPTGTDEFEGNGLDAVDIVIIVIFVVIVVIVAVIFLCIVIGSDSIVEGIARGCACLDCLDDCVKVLCCLC
jgi:hypothetical protein